MHAQTKLPVDQISLPLLAGYARFLLSHYLPEYARRYINALEAAGVDVHTYLPPDETKTLHEQFMYFSAMHLQLLAENKVQMQITASSSELRAIDHETPEDLKQKSAHLLRIGYIRKQIAKELLMHYTRQAEELMPLIEEMDAYSFAFDKAVNGLYLGRMATMLQTREEQLLEAQQLSGTGSYRWNLEEHRGDATPELLRMLHLEQAADVRQHLAAIHQDDLERVEATFQYAIQHQSNYELRYRFHTPDGISVILTKGKVVLLPEGLTIKGTVMDISEVEGMVQRLEESRALYREAQELARIGNWSWNTQTNEVLWSDEVYHICELGHDARQKLPDVLRQIVCPDDWQVIKKHLHQLRDSGTPFFYIGNIRLLNGTAKILEIKGKVANTDDAGNRQIIGTIQDVTNEQGLIRRLQDTERRYRHMEAIAHIGNWVIDIDSNKAEVTAEFLRIYGFKGDEKPDLATIRSFMHEEDRIVLDAFIENCRTAGAPYKFQCRIRTLQGEEKILLARGEALKDPNGRIYRLAGTAQDITKEQHLLRRLQSSEVLYKQAQAISRIGNWVYDVTTGKMEWSDELYHIFEISPDAADPAARARERMLQPERGLLDAHFARCLEQGVPYDCHYRIRLPDGTIRHLRSKGEVAPDIIGSARRLVGTVQDVTEQVNIERRLREQQLFTQKITDIAPSMIGVYNINTGEYLFMSLAVEKILGYSREQVLHDGAAFVTSLIHPDDLPALLEENAAALERANNQTGTYEDEIVEFKYRIKDARGNWHWLQTFGTIFERDEQGKVTLVLNVSVDISGEKQAELALNQKNVLLQQSNSSLEEFAYIASHDLQEPLRKISTFGNMLETLQEEALTDTGKLYLRKIVDSSIRMQQMISDVLSISIISGNKAFSSVSLQQLLDDALTTLEVKIEQTGAKVVIDQPLPEAHVVPAQFRQLFQNLVGNSLKFARTDVLPVIRIRYAYKSGEEVAPLGLDAGRRYLRLDLADNGIGFSNNYAGKIFAIFQRLHGKAEYEGTGIGLAVCKKIVEHHSGAIFADSAPGQGATFTIIIPV